MRDLGFGPKISTRAVNRLIQLFIWLLFPPQPIFGKCHSVRTAGQFAHISRPKNYFFPEFLDGPAQVWPPSLCVTSILFVELSFHLHIWPKSL